MLCLVTKFMLDSKFYAKTLILLFNPMFEDDTSSQPNFYDSSDLLFPCEQLWVLRVQQRHIWFHFFRITLSPFLGSISIAPKACPLIYTTPTEIFGYADFIKDKYNTVFESQSPLFLPIRDKGSAISVLYQSFFHRGYSVQMPKPCFQKPLDLGSVHPRLVQVVVIHLYILQHVECDQEQSFSTSQPYHGITFTLHIFLLGFLFGLFLSFSLSVEF